MFEALSKQYFWHCASYDGIAFPMDPRKSGQAGTSCCADNDLSNLNYSALRAMTVPERESAVMLSWIFLKLFEILRHMDLSRSQQLSDCVAGRWVIYLFYNTITPTVY